METTTRTYVSDLVDQIGSLPSLAAQIVTLASDPDCDIDKLTKIIRSDTAMTLRFLALANSAAVSQGREIKSLRTALIRLGLRRVRNVALLMGMHDMVPMTTTGRGLDGTSFWKYCLATASCAQGLAWIRGIAGMENAWLVGILHGLGIAALNQKAEVQFDAALGMADRDKLPLTICEMRVFDFHHGELAGRILREWRLPGDYCDAVEYYPEDFGDDELNDTTREMIDVLRAAILTARTIGFGTNGDGNAPPEVSDLAELLNLPEPAMEALAARVDRDVREMSALIGLDTPPDLFAATLAASRDEVARLGLAGLDDSLAREDLERQLASARDIQQRLLPEDLPELEGFRLAATNLPSLHVSGDTYDSLRLKDGRYALVIADVSGKGMAAALLASTLQASLRALARMFDDPGLLLSAVNEALFESTDPERFATVFLAVVNTDGDGIQYASAGHNPPLLLSSNGDCQWLKPAGTPLGMVETMTYPVFDVPLALGDLIVAYTDGVTEAVDARDVEFTEDGLERAVRSRAADSPSEIIDGIVDAVREHVGRTDAETTGGRQLQQLSASTGAIEIGDDLTLVVLQKHI